MITRILERVLWYLLGAATVWQIYASLERCGSIDGGTLVVPMGILIYFVGRDMARDYTQGGA